MTHIVSHLSCYTTWINTIGAECEKIFVFFSPLFYFYCGKKIKNPTGIKLVVPGFG